MFLVYTEFCFLTFDLGVNQRVSFATQHNITPSQLVGWVPPGSAQWGSVSSEYE